MNAVLPYVENVNDLNVPGINWHENCLTIYHKCEQKKFEYYKWLPQVQYKTHSTFEEKIEEKKKHL